LVVIFVAIFFRKDLNQGTGKTILSGSLCQNYTINVFLVIKVVTLFVVSQFLVYSILIFWFLLMIF